MGIASKIRERLAEGGVTGLLSTFVAKVRRIAWEFSPTRFRHRRAERAFDRELGVSTGGIVRLESLALEGDTWREGVRYQPTSLAGFRHMIDRLPIDAADYTFVDIGSGKGRAIFLAAEYAFPRIIGVEFSRELHAAAEANVERARARGSTAPFELVCEDATQYALPDEPTVLYMYNPFTGSVLERFFEHLSATLDARFRDLIIVYNNPTGEAHLSSSAWFERIDAGIGYVVYRSRRLAG